MPRCSNGRCKCLQGRCNKRRKNKKDSIGPPSSYEQCMCVRCRWLVKGADVTRDRSTHTIRGQIQAEIWGQGIHRPIDRGPKSRYLFAPPSACRSTLINLNVEGRVIGAAPVHALSRAPHLLPLLLSHNLPLPRSLERDGQTSPHRCVCIYYCRTYYKAVRVGGGG